MKIDELLKAKTPPDVSKLKVGDVVMVQRTELSEPIKAVVVDRNKNAVAVSRLRKDGTAREESLWAGQYFSVTKHK